MKLFVSLALAFLIAVPASTFAQGEQGRVAGIVRDESCALVGSAKVLVKNERTCNSSHIDGYAPAAPLQR